MSAPRLDELPATSANKRGWPWTETSITLPFTKSDVIQWPRITIVTPSFNQGQYLEETIRSILFQGYPNLEYIIIDGGSTDESVQIIKRYEKWLSYWISEPDMGQSHAINKGLAQGTGILATWINSDDLLHPNALINFGSKFIAEPRTVYVGRCTYIDAKGKPLRIHTSRVQSIRDLVRVGHVWRRRGNIVQPEVLFPLPLANELGLLDIANPYTMDYDLWGRLMLAGAQIQYTGIAMAKFRVHQDQKTQNIAEVTKHLLRNAHHIINLHPAWTEEEKRLLRDELQVYQKRFEARLRAPRWTSVLHRIWDKMQGLAAG